MRTDNHPISLWACRLALTLSIVCCGPVSASDDSSHESDSSRSEPERKEEVVKAMREAFGKDRQQIAHALHVLDCAERVLQISDLQADPLTVAVAAILHDIGRCQPATIDHERDGVPIARAILTKLAFDEPTVDHVARIVGSHHSAKGIETPEFRIVWIADRLVNQKRDHRDEESLKREYAKESTLLAQTIAAEKAAPQSAPTPLPPIECPLRKAGIDPQHLKPFDEVEKYIAFLEREDRIEWQKPNDVVRALGLKGTEIVADVGAGSGYFTFRLAKALPLGRVVAIDSQAEMARHIHRKVLNDGIKNIQAQVAKSEVDPDLPLGANVVFVCDVLMHVKKRAEWLRTIHAQMQTGARLVLIDFREGDLPQGPPEEIKVSKAEILRLCQEAGLTLTEDRSDLLPYQEFLVFERK